jgi:proliferating cell nuclear antigen
MEARFEKAVLMKRILDALKEITHEANFDCTPSGISLQVKLHIS